MQAVRETGYVPKNPPHKAGRRTTVRERIANDATVEVVLHRVGISECISRGISSAPNSDDPTHQ